MSVGDVLEQFDVEVIAKNDAPVAEAFELELDEDGSILFELNCTDIDGDSLTYEINYSSNYGTVSLSGTSGNYTPDADALMLAQLIKLSHYFIKSLITCQINKSLSSNPCRAFNMTGRLSIPSRDTKILLNQNISYKNPVFRILLYQ